MTDDEKDFIRWWETQGFWFARKHDITEELARQIWNEIVRYLW